MSGRNIVSYGQDSFTLRVEITKTRSTAYHPEGNRQTEHLQNTLKSMLKAGVQDDPYTWHELLDDCMIAFRSSVHSSRRQRGGVEDITINSFINQDTEKG